MSLKTLFQLSVDLLSFMRHCVVKNRTCLVSSLAMWPSWNFTKMFHASRVKNAQHEANTTLDSRGSVNGIRERDTVITHMDHYFGSPSPPVPHSLSPAPIQRVAFTDKLQTNWNDAQSEQHDSISASGTFLGRSRYQPSTHGSPPRRGSTISSSPFVLCSRPSPPFPSVPSAFRSFPLTSINPPGGLGSAVILHRIRKQPGRKNVC